jgi:dUTP pyrophosphatase
MSEAIIDAVASTIEITSESPITVEAEIPDALLPHLQGAFQIQPKISNNRLAWYGGDALYTIEALWSQVQKKQSTTFAQIYGRARAELQRQYSTLQVQKLIPEAIIPTKAHPLDSGFDLTVVRIVNPAFGPDVVLYGTGLAIRPPDGYYIDVVARSSTCRLGWGIANSVGIIDAQYRGELCIPLFKLSPNAKEIELPARIAQMIVRPLLLADIEEVASLNETQRGAGGFGSSGV